MNALIYRRLVAPPLLPTFQCLYTRTQATSRVPSLERDRELLLTRELQTGRSDGNNINSRMFASSKALARRRRLLRRNQHESRPGAARDHGTNSMRGCDCREKGRSRGQGGTARKRKEPGIQEPLMKATAKQDADSATQRIAFEVPGALSVLAAKMRWTATKTWKMSLVNLTVGHSTLTNIIVRNVRSQECGAFFQFHAACMQASDLQLGGNRRAGCRTIVVDPYSLEVWILGLANINLRSPTFKFANTELLIRS